MTGALMPASFQNAIALITGAASGIGCALAEELAHEGAHVIIADLQFELAESVATSINNAGGSAEAVKLDVTDATAFAELIARVKAERGRIDYLFNNAGIWISGGIKDYALSDWQRIIAINLMGVINGVQAVYPLMIAQGFGHIVNVASMAGLTPSAGMAGYSATKHAVVALSQSLRVEAAFHGVDVSVLCPGAIRTPLLKNGGEFGKQLGATTDEQALSDWEKMRPIDANTFAKKALKSIAKKRGVIIVPGWYQLLWWLARLAPQLILKGASNQYKEQHLDRMKSRAK
jgi:short-subunit dehydrogenase